MPCRDPICGTETHPLSDPFHITPHISHGECPANFRATFFGVPPDSKSSLRGTLVLPYRCSRPFFGAKLGILLGLASAFCWGAGDLFITFLARSAGTAKALGSIQALSLVMWLVLAWFMAKSPSAPSSVWWLVAACGGLHVVGLVLTYRAFEIGTLSIVSPFASSFAVVTAIFALAFGEKPAMLALGGAALLVLGVVIVTGSAQGDQARSLKGVPEAIGSAVAFGIMFWLAEFVQPSLGPIVPLVILKVCALSYALLLMVFAKGKPDTFAEPRPFSSALWLAFLAAAADTLAWLAFLYGTTHTFTTVVTALASLFSAFTVVLAWIFLKERLTGRQCIGIVVVLAGVALVSL